MATAIAAVRSIPRTMLHLTLQHCSRPLPPLSPPPSHFNYLAQLEGKKSGERGEEEEEERRRRRRLPGPGSRHRRHFILTPLFFSSLLLFLFAAVGLEAAVGRAVGTGGSLVKITSSCVMCLSPSLALLQPPPPPPPRTEEARRGECCCWIGA